MKKIENGKMTTAGNVKTIDAFAGAKEIIDYSAKK